MGRYAGAIVIDGKYRMVAFNMASHRNLLALAGGPVPDGSLNDVKVTRLGVIEEFVNRLEGKQMVWLVLTARR